MGSWTRSLKSTSYTPASGSALLNSSNKASGGWSAPGRCAAEYRRISPASGTISTSRNGETITSTPSLGTVSRSTSRTVNSAKAASLPASVRRSSESFIVSLLFPHVLDEAEVLRHLVVKGAARRVGGVGEPVNPRGTGLPGDLRHALDERAADAMAAVVRRREQILQVTHRGQPRCAAMEDV